MTFMLIACEVERIGLQAHERDGELLTCIVSKQVALTQVLL